MGQTQATKQHYYELFKHGLSACPNCAKMDWRITQVPGGYRFWCFHCDWVYTEAFEGKREQPRAE